MKSEDGSSLIAYPRGRVPKWRGGCCGGIGGRVLSWWWVRPGEAEARESEYVLDLAEGLPTFCSTSALAGDRRACRGA